MRILDIGAGSDFIDPKRPDSDLEESEGGIQQAYHRWRVIDTVKQMRRLLKTKERLFVDGVDLTKPRDFRSKNKIQFVGKTMEEVGDDQYDAITWLNPNPWNVVRLSTRIKQEFDNPLDVVVEAVQRNLKVEGFLVLETEMPMQKKSQDYDPWDTYSILQMIRAELEKVLSLTELPFATNDPWRETGLVFKKDM